MKNRLLSFILSIVLTITIMSCGAAPETSDSTDPAPSAAESAASDRDSADSAAESAAPNRDSAAPAADSSPSGDESTVPSPEPSGSDTAADSEEIRESMTQLISSITAREQAVIEQLDAAIRPALLHIGRNSEEIRSNAGALEEWYALEQSESAGLYMEIGKAAVLYFQLAGEYAAGNAGEWSAACDRFETEVVQKLYENYRYYVYDFYYMKIYENVIEGVLRKEDGGYFAPWSDFRRDLFKTWLQSRTASYTSFSENEALLTGSLADFREAENDPGFDPKAFLSSRGLDTDGEYTINPDAASEMKYLTPPAQPSEEEEEEEFSYDFGEVTAWYRSHPWQICSGIYFAGSDLSTGSYELKPASEDPVYLYLFDTAEDYHAYFTSDRYTIEKEYESLTRYSSLQIHVDSEAETAFDLREGNVLILEGGIADLSRTDTMANTSAVPSVGEPLYLRAGKYIAGKDIKAGKYILTCPDSGSRALIFESDGKTAGITSDEDYSDRAFEIFIEQNALIDLYDLSDGEQGYVNLRDGMALVLIEGTYATQEVTLGWM